MCKQYINVMPVSTDDEQGQFQKEWSQYVPYTVTIISPTPNRPFTVPFLPL